MGVRPLSNGVAGGMPEMDDAVDDAGLSLWLFVHPHGPGPRPRHPHLAGARHETEGSTQEPVFVPRSPDAPEGDGFLLAVVTRPENPADLLLLDAMDTEVEPLAVVRLPFSQAWLFHGPWRDGAASLPR